MFHMEVIFRLIRKTLESFLNLFRPCNTSHHPSSSFSPSPSQTPEMKPTPTWSYQNSPGPSSNPGTQESKTNFGTFTLPFAKNAATHPRHVPSNSVTEPPNLLQLNDSCQNKESPKVLRNPHLVFPMKISHVASPIVSTYPLLDAATQDCVLKPLLIKSPQPIHFNSPNTTSNYYSPSPPPIIYLPPNSYFHPQYFSSHNSSFGTIIPAQSHNIIPTHYVK